MSSFYCLGMLRDLLFPSRCLIESCKWYGSERRRRTHVL